MTGFLPWESNGGEHLEQGGFAEFIKAFADRLLEEPVAAREMLAAMAESVQHEHVERWAQRATGDDTIGRISGVETVAVSEVTPDEIVESNGGGVHNNLDQLREARAMAASLAQPASKVWASHAGTISTAQGIAPTDTTEHPQTAAAKQVIAPINGAGLFGLREAA